MAKAVLLRSGGGGTTSDELTSVKSNVLEGTTAVTSDSDDEAVEGTMKNYSGTQQESSEIRIENDKLILSISNDGYYYTDSAITSNTANLGDATTDKVLSGSTFTSSAGLKLNGGMTDNGAVAPAALGAGESYTIAPGYHNGKGKITVQSLATICAAATLDSNSRMLDGYKAYGKNGTLYTGNIASLAGGTYNASSTSRTISCAGKYMTSNIVISATNVQSIISFSFASRNYATANFKWQNPAKGPFYGIVVRGKQGGYPTSVSDGTAIYTGYGSNTAASGTSYSGFKSVGTGTWYFSAFSYFVLDGSNVYSSAKQTSAQFSCYDCNNCPSNYCDCSDCYHCDNCGNCQWDCGDCAGYCGGDCGCHGPIEGDNCNQSWSCPDCSQCDDCPGQCNGYCDDNNNCTKCTDYPASCIANT